MGFVETRLELLKLEAKEESIKVIARLLTIAVIVLFGTLFFIFFSVMIAIILNHALDSAYLGFAILSAFFMLLLISVLVIKKTRWFHSRITAITDQLVEVEEDSNEEAQTKINEDERTTEITGNSQ
jgi:uncharacterized membrane protein YqjE